MAPRRSSIVAVSSIALAASGCALQDKWGDPQVFDEIESACPVFPGDDPWGWSDTWPAPYPFEANDAISFVVWFSGNLCFSGSCSRHASSCEVEVQGNTIVLDAAVRVETLKAQKGEPLGTVTCTADCESYSATCEVQPLPAGTYEVVDANASPGDEPLFTFGFPSEIEVCDPPPNPTW